VVAVENKQTFPHCNAVFLPSHTVDILHTSVHIYIFDLSTVAFAFPKLQHVHPAENMICIYLIINKDSFSKKKMQCGPVF
jgi:hypothetical protein